MNVMLLHSFPAVFVCRTIGYVWILLCKTTAVVHRSFFYEAGDFKARLKRHVQYYLDCSVGKAIHILPCGGVITVIPFFYKVFFANPMLDWKK